MTMIPPSRNLIQSEETDYKSAVSESILTRVGAVSNFIALKQWLTFEYKLNGSYQFAVNEKNLDGMFIFPVACEIGFISYANAVKGASGSTSLDIEWFSNSGISQGSVFATKPIINSNAPNNAYIIRDVINSLTIGGGGSGTNIPVFNKTSFAAGDAVAVNIDDAMDGAENFNLTIYFRPI